MMRSRKLPAGYRWALLSIDEKERGPDGWEEHASIPSYCRFFFGKSRRQKQGGGSSGAKEFFPFHFQVGSFLSSFARWTCMHPLRLSLLCLSLLLSTVIFSESRGRKLEVGFSLTISPIPTPLLFHSAPLLAILHWSFLFLPYISLPFHPFSAVSLLLLFYSSPPPATANNDVRSPNTCLQVHCFYVSR